MSLKSKARKIASRLEEKIIPILEDLKAQLKEDDEKNEISKNIKEANRVLEIFKNEKRIITDRDASNGDLYLLDILAAIQKTKNKLKSTLEA